MHNVTVDMAELYAGDAQTLLSRNVDNNIIRSGSMSARVP